MAVKTGSPMSRWGVYEINVYIFTFNVFNIVGGGSASKEHNKKRAAENKEIPNIDILAFSPERRWVAVRMDVGESSMLAVEWGK